MSKCLIASWLFVLLFLFSGAVYAENTYLSESYVRYDSRYYPEFVHHRGGAEGHSGAYISIVVGIDNYSDIQSVNIKAKHTASGFEVSLKEDSIDCVGLWPIGPVDQWFSIALRPEHTWMVGDWEIEAKVKTLTDKVTEVAYVSVPRFNFPPEPTGIQISEYQGKTWLVWNRIGDPEVGISKHVEYRIAHHTSSPAACIDEFYLVRPGGNIYYELWSGNRIAVELPSHWVTGDLIRVENRIYDDNNGETYRHDRGTRYFYTP